MVEKVVFLKLLPEWCNNYPLAPDKIEIKREILFNYQIDIVDFTTFLLAMLKGWYLTFLIKKTTCFIMRTSKDYSFFCAQSLDKKLGSSLIYFF